MQNNNLVNFIPLGSNVFGPVHHWVNGAPPLTHCMSKPLTPLPPALVLKRSEPCTQFITRVTSSLKKIDLKIMFLSLIQWILTWFFFTWGMVGWGLSALWWPVATAFYLILHPGAFFFFFFLKHPLLHTANAIRLFPQLSRLLDLPAVERGLLSKDGVMKWNQLHFHPVRWTDTDEAID